MEGWREGGEREEGEEDSEGIQAIARGSKGRTSSPMHDKVMQWLCSQLEFTVDFPRLGIAYL